MVECYHCNYCVVLQGKSEVLVQHLSISVPSNVIFRLHYISEVNIVLFKLTLDYPTNFRQGRPQKFSIGGGRRGRDKATVCQE